MRTNDIVDIYIAYIDKPGGKNRPVLIIKLLNSKAWLLKITSKYKEKSENIDSIAYCILYLFHDSILIQKTAKYTLL